MGAMNVPARHWNIIGRLRTPRRRGRCLTRADGATSDASGLAHAARFSVPATSDTRLSPAHYVNRASLSTDYAAHVSSRIENVDRVSRRSHNVHRVSRSGNYVERVCRCISNVQRVPQYVDYVERV
ncbi:hypothetical protein HMPREF1868_01049 [Olsenella sp. DNF00959]|nr:hypothetical protein HMPREF1868_01049 [Olsenella sp. DNF00959]